MGEYRLVPYEPRLRPQLFALMREVWGEYMSEEEFAWWFDGNPVGPLLVTLAEDDQGLVGMLAMSFARMRVGGREIFAAAAVQGATLPRARSRGVFRTLELYNEDRAAEAGAELAVGFTNPAAGPILVDVVHWRDVGPVRLWARPRAGLLGRTGPVLRDEAGDVEEFGEEHEELYRRVAFRWPDHYVRDTAYLNWRYSASPRGYRLYETRAKDGLSGFAVLGAARHHGRDVAVVADLVADGFTAARQLLRRCLRACGRGADALVAVPPPGFRAAFLSQGLAPTPVTIRLVGKPLAERGRIGRWYFALGDTDIF